MLTLKWKYNKAFSVSVLWNHVSCRDTAPPHFSDIFRSPYDSGYRPVVQTQSSVISQPLWSLTCTVSASVSSSHLAALHPCLSEHHYFMNETYLRNVKVLMTQQYQKKRKYLSSSWELFQLKERQGLDQNVWFSDEELVNDSRKSNKMKRHQETKTPHPTLCPIPMFLYIIPQYFFSSFSCFSLCVAPQEADAFGHETWNSFE